MEGFLILSKTTGNTTDIRIKFGSCFIMHIYKAYNACYAKKIQIDI